MRGLPVPAGFSRLLVFQSIVGAEGLSLAFRHIASSLLGHCSQVSCESLLHEVIVCVGYFSVNHPDNQVRGPGKFLSPSAESVRYGSGTRLSRVRPLPGPGGLESLTSPRD